MAMELRDYLHIFRKRIAVIIAVIIIGTGATLAVLSSRNPGFDTSVALTINRINTQQTTEYKYDQFYALSATDLFGKSVIGWMSTPSIIDAVFNDAGLPIEFSGIADEAGFFSGRRLAPQVIEVRYTYKTEEGSKKLNASLIKVLQGEIDKLNAQTVGESYFTIVAADPVVLPGSNNLLLVGLIAFVVSAFVGLNLALLLDYLKRKPVREA